MWNMLDELRTLIALESTGTISEAAVRLRLTQSAVSKRIQALEFELGYKVTEPDGRKLKLTSKGLLLLSKARPLLLEIEGLKDLGDSAVPRAMAIGISDSVASSWGPKLIKKALRKVEDLHLEFHVHRSTMVLEQIRSGRYELGIITGAQQGTDLIWNLLVEEPMVLVGQSESSKESGTILSIETNSATWKEIGKRVLDHEKLLGSKFVFLESFSAAIQMAREGFGRALVPIGLTKSFGIKSHELITLSPRITRQVHLVTRKSVSGIQCVGDLGKAMSELAVTLL
jgi:DNA-binding transcriptional LysR family regulator